MTTTGTITLRPYQEQAASEIMKYAAEHISGRMLLVLPPGGGKTAVAAIVAQCMAANNGLRALAWAHRRELVWSLCDHMIEVGIPEQQIGVIMPGSKRMNPAALIQVASVDALRHRDKPEADIVISDEAHHDASNGRQQLRKLYPEAFHLGLTATPFRLDGRSLRDEYDEILVAATPSLLAENGWISRPRMFTVPEDRLPHLNAIPRKNGDFSPEALDQAMRTPTLIGNIVDHWRRLAENRPTVAFASSIQHAKAICDRFRAAGIAADHIDGDTPLATRATILLALANGKLQVVTSKDVLSEGVNVPAIKCVIMARPTESASLVIQQAGRCMRPYPDVEPLILDHAGNLRRHGAPDADRDWAAVWLMSSTPGEREAAKRLLRKAVRACPTCGRITSLRATLCPECNTVFWALPADVPETDGALAEWERIAAFARARSIDERWAARVLRTKLAGGVA